MPILVNNLAAVGTLSSLAAVEPSDYDGGVNCYTNKGRVIFLYGQHRLNSSICG